MYEVKAEKKPVSAFRATRSMTCEGVCKGMGGRGMAVKLLGEKDGMRELVNRLSHMRMI
jgi:hypothetical protein